MKRSDELRVAFVLGQNATGGTESQARSLIAALRARGLEIDTFLVDGAAGMSGLPADTVILADERPVGVTAVIRYIAMAVRLRALLREGKYSVVHSAMARGYFVTTLATLGPRGIRHVSWRRNVGIHLDGRSARLLGWFERFALRRADLIVVNSEDVAEFWCGLGGRPVRDCVVIPNILDEWRFDEVEPALPPGDRLRIVTVGGLKPEKGHCHLIAALASSENLRTSTELLIVGDGRLRDVLRRQAADAGVALRLAGAVDDPRPWLWSAQLYVHPSLSEGSSNAVAEAMAAGLPVVATRVGGMSELLGTAGVLVDPGDRQGLATAISRLCSDPSELESLGCLARSRMRERSRPDQVVSEYLTAYGVR